MSMNTEELGYLSGMSAIMEHGFDRRDRTGVGTRALFCTSLSFDLRRGRIPLLTTKKVHWKSVLVELLWMLSGSTNVRDLQAQGVSIWDEWASADGSLGPVYGGQWRHWNATIVDSVNRSHGIASRFSGSDQIAQLIDGMKGDPHGRRHIVTAWNPSDLSLQKLPPCHCFFQCFVTDQGLILQMYQRSADWFLGVPFNIASYATLTHILARCIGTTARGLSITFGDAHIYKNHFKQAEEQLSRSVRDVPTLTINKQVDSIDKLSYDDFTVEGYNPWPAIKAPVAV